MFVVERLKSVSKQITKGSLLSVAFISHDKAMTRLRLKQPRLLALVMVRFVIFALFNLSVSRTFPRSA